MLGFDLGDAKARGIAQGAARDRQRALLQQDPDALGNLEGTLGIGARQQRNELLAADARELVDDAQLGLGPVREIDQHRIADCMAMVVVDRLEVVEVDRDQRQRLAEALGALDLDPGQLGEGAPVGQAGQRVGARLVLGQFLLLAQLLGRLRHPLAQHGLVRGQAGGHGVDALGQRAQHASPTGIDPGAEHAAAELGHHHADAAQRLGHAGSDQGGQQAGKQQAAAGGDQGPGQQFATLALQDVELELDQHMTETAAARPSWAPWAGPRR